MNVIENRKQLIDQIKQRELEGSTNQPFNGSEPSSNLQALAKHAASEAIDKCSKEHEKRTNEFLLDLNQRRLDRIENILQANWASGTSFAYLFIPSF